MQVLHLQLARVLKFQMMDQNESPCNPYSELDQMESYVFPLQPYLHENQAWCGDRIEGPVGAFGHPFSLKCLTLCFGRWIFQ